MVHPIALNDQTKDIKFARINEKYHYQQVKDHYRTTVHTQIHSHVT